jgi:hypothetical protein
MYASTHPDTLYGQLFACAYLIAAVPQASSAYEYYARLDLHSELKFKLLDCTPSLLCSSRGLCTIAYVCRFAADGN